MSFGGWKKCQGRILNVELREERERPDLRERIPDSYIFRTFHRLPFHISSVSMVAFHTHARLRHHYQRLMNFLPNHFLLVPLDSTTPRQCFRGECLSNFRYRYIRDNRDSDMWSTCLMTLGVCTTTIPWMARLGFRPGILPEPQSWFSLTSHNIDVNSYQTLSSCPASPIIVSSHLDENCAQVKSSTFLRPLNPSRALQPTRISFKKAKSAS